ncbi:MAG: TRAP transporter substrate-binding protein [Bacteroidota bacterium]|nr:TRAP transporter substrate-binding protein [Bacteroidota bacterium]MDE2833018.1 TRAP transporter substrate-binding protein [Bacteroidota bacterium]MDE2958412.1 TRAP transporter substrate-binding protein [Bacteroidota bacterium]
MPAKKSIAALVTAMLIVCGCGESSNTRELSLAHFLAPSHVLNDYMFTPLSQEIAEISGGQLTIRQYAAGALNSSAPAQYAILLSGVADIALVIPSYTSDRFPKTDLLMYPGICKTALACTSALMRAYPTLEVEYDAKILGLWGNSAPVLLTRDKPVRRLEDMRGLKIRVPTQSAIPFIEALGASAVMQSATVVHQSLATGVIDGVAVSPSGIEAFQLHEPARYLTTWLPLSGLPFVLLMNQRVYDTLPPDQRNWIDETAGLSLSEKGAAAFTQSSINGLRMAEEAGVQIIDLQESEKRRFEEAIAPVREAQLERRAGDMTVAEVIRLFSVGQ